jgi:intermediate peptidase
LLTERIVRARQSRDELLKVVKNLDRLSDMLCSVIDLAELVRNAHPDPEWVTSANEAYVRLCEYMNVLNTHVGLYEVRAMPCAPTPSFASYNLVQLS